MKFDCASCFHPREYLKEVSRGLSEILSFILYAIHGEKLTQYLAGT